MMKISFALKSMSQESKSTIHPFDVFQPDWTIHRQMIQINDLIVQHDLAPPSEFEYPPSTHHLVCLALSPNYRQVTHIAKYQHEGLFDIGEFFLQPSTYPGFYSWETDDEAIVFFVEPDFLSRIAAQTECIDPDKVELRPIAIGRDTQIEYIARSFLTEMRNSGLGGRLFSEALATQLAIHLLRNYCAFPLQLKQYKGGLSRQQLKAAIDYVDAYLESNISLSDLAQVTQINSTYSFSRLFKQSTGVTPYQYVIQQRIERAKQLLKQDDLPLIEIALICGFSSQSAFNRAFSRSVKMTPRSYRQQI